MFEISGEQRLILAVLALGLGAYLCGRSDEQNAQQRRDQWRRQYDMESRVEMLECRVDGIEANKEPPE
ncbi:MAG: hypothetical protein KY410_07900 [Proteobacteria bacterium]|nr:hypothetical protein [Pseudomonadota bacterium]